MSSKREIRAAQREVHQAVKALGSGINALADALTALGLVLDQHIERVLAADTTVMAQAKRRKRA